MIEGALDYALLAVMGYFFLRGLFRGVVKEVVAVLGIFVAFWVASIYWPLGEEHLKALFDLPGQRGVTSFILIFVVVYFLVSIISIFFDKIVKMTISPVISALLGSVVGLVKGVLFCAVIMVGAETFLKPTEDLFTKSQIWPHLKPIAHQAKAWMPGALQKAMEAKKTLPAALGGQGRTGAQEAATDLDSVDWSTVRNLLATRPDEISQAWKDKLRSVSGPEALTKDDLKRFIADHPALFSTPAPPASPAGARGSDSQAPSWPQPATE